MSVSLEPVFSEARMPAPRQDLVEHVSTGARIDIADVQGTLRSWEFRVRGTRSLIGSAGPAL